MSEPVSLHVNGRVHEVVAGPDTALLTVLRNDLGLLGSRFGCGLGQCGACFVLLDGHPTPSCDTPVWAAAGKEIETVEGLGPPVGDAVRRAFLDEQAAQCGYCTAGLVVSATALLRSTPEPGEAQVRAALDRNLCRCGAHNRVVRAVIRAGRRLHEGGDGGDGDAGDDGGDDG